MILAVDVNYRAGHAVIAGVAFEHWPDSEIQASYNSILEADDDYIPGLFYKRELPCILK